MARKETLKRQETRKSFKQNLREHVSVIFVWLVIMSIVDWGMFKPNIDVPLVSFSKTSLAASIGFKKNHWYIEELNIDKVWEKGYTGNGVTIGTVEWGVDMDLLGESWRGKDSDMAFCHWKDPVGNKKEPYTRWKYSHGTSTLGAAIGNHGVAPNAQWIMSNIQGEKYNARSAALGLKWLAQPCPGKEYVPDVVYLSMGIDHWANDYFDKLIEKDVVIVMAAGNGGRKQVHEYYTGKYPDNVLVVGGSNLKGKVWLFSAYPNTEASKKLPFVLAPAHGIPTKLPYVPLWYGAQGTSFASPLVAGVAALLREANPDATAREIIEAIASTTRSVEGEPYGIVDADAALEYILNLPRD